MAQDRFTVIESKLKELSASVPGLNEQVELSFNGISIQEYIRSLASSSNLNITVDGNINVKIYTNFSNATVKDILLLLCKKYDLDITFIGSIMSVSQFIPAPATPVRMVSKVLKISYDKATDQLSFDLSNDSLSSVVKEITRVSQKNVLFSQEFANKMVNGYIQNAPFKGALDKLAFANEFKVTATDDNYFLIEKKDPEIANLKGKTGRNDKNSRQSVNIPEGLNVKVDAQGLISVDAVNTPIVDILGVVSGEIKNNYYLFSEPKGNATLNITGATFDDFLKHLLNGTDYTFKKESGVYLIGERNIEGLRATKLVQLKYRTAEKIIDIIPADLKKGLDIKPFPDLNSLVLSGSQPRIDELEAFMREIDRVVPVVVIEVILVDVNDTRSVTTGIQAGLGAAPATTTIGPDAKNGGASVLLNATSINKIISGVNGFGLVNLGKVTANFFVALQALETKGALKVRSTPKLATLNGHEAKMSIGKTEYYLELQTTVLGSVTTSSQQSTIYKPLNADLSITINPMVSGDEQITLDIKVKQSTFTSRVGTSGPFGSLTRDFQSLIRVKNEEMIILGGLEESSTNETSSGIPLISRIPILKWFFSSRSNIKTKTKLNIFIRPSIIY
jgi:type IV pilus assembly protein PilQ